MEGRFVGVIHSAASAAIPRAGLNIIRFITRTRGDGLVLFACDGPLVGASGELGLPCRVVNRGAFASGIFRAMVNAAREELRDLQPAVLYVNSCAASAWAVAGRQLGLKVILHVYELDREIMALLHVGATCIDVCAAADVVVVSGEAVVSSIRKCLGYVPADLLDAGSLLDGSEISRRAKAEVSPRWLFGRRYVRSARKLIAMWGTASFHNGIDIFAEMTRQMPKHDFLWIGAWTEDANSILAERGFFPEKQSNLYCTGEIENPYPLIAMCDLFALTAREAEYPADITELARIGTPIVCFSQAIDSWMISPRSFHVLYGMPRVDRLIRCISSVFEDDRGTRRVLPDRGPNLDCHKGLAHLSDELRIRGIL